MLYDNLSSLAIAGPLLITSPDCGDKPNEASPLTDDTDCSVPCAGDATQPCGAGNRISIYNGPAGEPTPPAPIEGWAYEGCWRYVVVPAPRLFFSLTPF